MLENGAEPNLNDANGRTPLHSAAMARLPGDHLGIARLLVTRGANVNIKDNDGEFPLSMVISNNHFTSQKKVAMVKFLVEEAGANVNNRGTKLLAHFDETLRFWCTSYSISTCNSFQVFKRLFSSCL